MATSMNKKKATVKPSTVNKVENVSENNGTLAEEVKEEKTPVARKFEQTDLIPCRSITTGLLVMTGIRSGNSYAWLGMGETIDVEYRDVMALVTSKSGYLFKPRFIVDDDDFVNQNPSLKTFYDGMYTTRDLKSILYINNESEMINAINNMPKGIIPTLRNTAVTMISHGDIDSIHRIKTIASILDIDVDLLPKFND